MIGYIEGQVVASEAQRIIVLTVQGLGYEVHVPAPQIPGKKVALFTTHIIREDSQSLFGFVDLEEKRLFEMLVEVNGVGPKTAFALIAHLGHVGVVQAITLENSGILKQAPGIGKKSAEQIILSLKDKMERLGIVAGLTPLKNDMKLAVTELKDVASHLVGETLQACQELGYKEQYVLPVMQRLMAQGEFQNSEDLLRSLLKELR